jgi:hypothetical protein
MEPRTRETTEDDAIVAFFEGLGESARSEYAALAELDRRFGEDVVAERRAPRQVRGREP